ncbi:LSU ribosomal protein MRPL25 [Metschnikowia aff. pulcherrima]|uniref:LSU ribosomal protein MRPL25 n=1 Tax=Metschnikowia aff. pulcherrima TaxID=2163413 RepID=A0A4P6XTD1_9ASCO|nr:LSU ribosomal protein MRPL25 [Metschnikowia aff. pulcherrima]
MSLSPKEAFAKLPQKLHNFFIRYPPRPFASYLDKPSTISDPALNPFLPNKNSETGRWHAAKVSMRRSADLFKMARKYGLEDLLPPIPHRKFYEDKYYNKNWMRGVMFQKKQKWERELPEKLEKRRIAMENMDETILAARPSYKKQLQKREQKKRTWF